LKPAKAFSQDMRSIQSPRAAQATYLTSEQALDLARERFPNLCCQGILPRKAIGTKVDLDDIDVALAFLEQCRPTKNPTVHSFDLRRTIKGDVQLGAVIAAAVALGFGTHSWFDITCYAPHALIAVNQNDVGRVARALRQGNYFTPQGANTLTLSTNSQGKQFRI
jgi:hypothetical protein